MNNSLYTVSSFIDFIEKVFGKGKMTNGNLEVVCPICAEHKTEFYSKKKLSINLGSKQAGMIKCWVCGYKSMTLTFILKKYFANHLDEYKKKFLTSEALVNKEESTELEEAILEFPSGFTLLSVSDSRDPYINKALEYLEARKIDFDRDLWYWKLGVSVCDPSLINRIIVPSFDENGSFNFFSARTFIDNLRPKYQNPKTNRENIIFNEININWAKEIVIVEGVFDLLKCPDNATCLLGSELTGNYKLFREIVKHKTPTILALDSNVFSKTLKIAQRFLEFDVPVKILEIPNDFEDVGSMTKDEFINILPDATMFDADYALIRKIHNII